MTPLLTISSSSTNFIENPLIPVTGFFSLHKSQIAKLGFLGYLVESYYCLDGTVYPCPDLGSVLSSRLSTSLYFLQDMMAMFESMKKKGLYTQTGQDQNIASLYEAWLSLEKGDRAKINHYIAYFDQSLSTK